MRKYSSFYLSTLSHNETFSGRTLVITAPTPREHAAVLSTEYFDVKGFFFLAQRPDLTYDGLLMKERYDKIIH